VDPGVPLVWELATRGNRRKSLKRKMMNPHQTLPCYRVLFGVHQPVPGRTAFPSLPGVATRPETSDLMWHAGVATCRMQIPNFSSRSHWKRNIYFYLRTTLMSIFLVDAVRGSSPESMVFPSGLAHPAAGVCYMQSNPVNDPYRHQPRECKNAILLFHTHSRMHLHLSFRGTGL
jgi:hypothetical protein